VSAGGQAEGEGEGVGEAMGGVGVDAGWAAELVEPPPQPASAAQATRAARPAGSFMRHPSTADGVILSTTRDEVTWGGGQQGR
jgi:hypothetical protein